MRLRREATTIEAMIRIFCVGKGHAMQALCEDCQALRDYALQRVDSCGFGAEKPVCAKCRVHCYKPEMRERVREVMRYAGPKMITRHPVLALLHLLDSARSRA